MKATLIGVGQAGGKLTEALVAQDRSTGASAIRGAVAVNTAEADLLELDVETVLVGRDRVNGQGVGGDNELAAEIMAADGAQVMGALDDHVGTATEAIVVAAGLGGGTGSGGAPLLARELKRVYDVPVYVLGVLPGRDEGSMYLANAGRSLKTVTREADAAILVDNDALRSGGESVSEGYAAINRSIARRIGLLLAAGEAEEGVGESVVDSSEIINTLRGGAVAAVGYANAEAAPDAAENVNVVTSLARRAVLNGLSLPEATEAEAALLVVAGRPERIPRKGVERARRWVEEETGSLQVRGGDFPLESDHLAALVVLSGLERSDRVQSFVDQARAAQRGRERPNASELFQNEKIDDLL